MNALKKLWLTVLNEPAVIVGVVIAAVNATTTQTWQGYAAAIVTALLRFVVTGPITAQGKTSPPGP